MSTCTFARIRRGGLHELEYKARLQAFFKEDTEVPGKRKEENGARGLFTQNVPIGASHK